MFQFSKKIPECYFFLAVDWGEEEVNRVRVMRRGWDALNMNFNSPVRLLRGTRGLYWFSSKKWTSMD